MGEAQRLTRTLNGLNFLQKRETAFLNVRLSGEEQLANMYQKLSEIEDLGFSIDEIKLLISNYVDAVSVLSIAVVQYPEIREIITEYENKRNLEETEHA